MQGFTLDDPVKGRVFAIRLSDFFSIISQEAMETEFKKTLAEHIKNDPEIQALITHHVKKVVDGLDFAKVLRELVVHLLLGGMNREQPQSTTSPSV